jgi:two-component system, OmpR family, response regulator
MGTEVNKRARGRVLVVDDDDVALEITRERLEAAGWEVVLQHGGLGTAVTALRTKPDFVLLDVNMPALNGDAIARYLIEGRRANAVILYSAIERDELTALAASCGAIGAVQKTGDARQFLVQFESCVNEARNRA